MQFQRSIESKIMPYVGSHKIIMILGARQCGKTTVLKKIQAHLQQSGNTCHLLTMEDPQLLALCNEHPKKLLEFASPVVGKKTYYLIDEIQYLKQPTNFLKYIYDLYKDDVQLIVTGSSSFYLDTKFVDSLAGRKVTFDMYTLSWKEFLIFKQQDQLIQEIHTGSLSLLGKRQAEELYKEYLIYGGYPELVLTSNVDQKKEFLNQYIREYVKKDVMEGGVEYLDKYIYLFKILASQIGKLVNANELSNILGLSAPATQKYLQVMQKSYHISLVKPFFNNIRKEIIKMPKVYCYDTGLRNSLVNNFEYFDTHLDKGSLFEQAVYRSLLEKHHRDDVRYWRTKTDQEVDFIVQGQQAIEVKLNRNNFSAHKYKTFTETYPNIPLQCIDQTDILMDI